MLDELSYKSEIPFLANRRTYQSKTDMKQTHYHHHYEILYIYENSRVLHIGDKQYTLNKNNVAFVPPLIPHRTLSDSSLTQSRLLINFASDFLTPISKALNFDLLSCFNQTVPVFSCEKIFEKFNDLSNLLIEDSNHFGTEHSKVSAQLHLSELLLLFNEGLLSRECRNSRNEISEITKYIEEHFNEHLSLDILARKFSTNKYTLSKKFNIKTGLSLPKYISLIRVVRSKRYIADGKEITDVAFECGFNSLNDFDRVFKREVGMSPLQYKKVQEAMRKN